MKNTTNLRYAIVNKNYYGHNGAVYKGDKVVVKEISSKGIKVTDLGGRVYWFKDKDITLI
tara:strand:+ start:619 stop:798 length:180 start_codon:yes stop_codon:yes gene_type:complete